MCKEIRRVSKQYKRKKKTTPFPLIFYSINIASHQFWSFIFCLIFTKESEDWMGKKKRLQLEKQQQHAILPHAEAVASPGPFVGISHAEMLDLKNKIKQVGIDTKYFFFD